MSVVWMSASYRIWRCCDQVCWAGGDSSSELSNVSFRSIIYTSALVSITCFVVGMVFLHLKE